MGYMEQITQASRDQPINSSPAIIHPSSEFIEQEAQKIEEAYSPRKERVMPRSKETYIPSKSPPEQLVQVSEPFIPPHFYISPTSQEILRKVDSHEEFLVFNSQVNHSGTVHKIDNIMSKGTNEKVENFENTHCAPQTSTCQPKIPDGQHE